MIFEKNIGFAAIILLSFLLIITNVYAATISACGAVAVPGYYALDRSISSVGTCLTVTVDNVEIDCLGYTITYDTGQTTTKMGIDATNGANARTNLTVRNCRLIKPTTSQTAGYGIRLTRYSNSKLINNTIFTNGTTNNYGIYITTNCQNNSIENNTIYTSGTSTGNAGIYLLTGVFNNTIKNNIISTSGTTTGYGIWISGVTTPSEHNEISSNNIATSGSNANNWGIYLYRNASSTNITGNNISTSGTTTNHGIYAIGTTDLGVNYNIIDRNIINATGTTTPTNYGVVISTNANYNNITNNNITTRGTTNNWGVYIVGANALPANSNTVSSNNIQTLGTTTTNYGVYLVTNANNNNITNNSIFTTGTANNYGVYVSGDTLACNYNEFSYNNISATGTVNANYGIYLYRNVNSNEVLCNTIFTNGTTTNHGIYAVGTTGENINYTVVDSNVINVTGIGASSNVGIWFSTNADYNNITNNTIATQGTTANYGIQLIGTAPLASNNNLISSNVVKTLGTTTNNWGIYLSTNTNYNNIGNNVVSTQGTSGNYGIYVVGAAGATSDHNLVTSNNIQATGSANNNYGVYLATNVDSGTVVYNNISTSGTATNHGVYVSGTTLPCFYNQISFNNISAVGTQNSNYGIYLYRNVSSTNVTNNFMSTQGTATNYGVYLLGTAFYPLNANIIDSNVLSVSNSDIIDLDLGSQNITIKNNTIINRDPAYNDISFSATGINETSLVDQYLEKYAFTSAGGTIIVENTAFGKIDFYRAVNGSGANFSKDITILENYLYVNSSQNGLNKSAKLSIYNLNFIDPIILRDNITCDDCNKLSYIGGLLIFNVTRFSSYSAEENPANIPLIDSMVINDSIIPEDEIILSAGTTRRVYCDVAVSDSLGVDNVLAVNATFYYYKNSSKQGDENSTHYTDINCSLNQTTVSDKIFSCTFDVWYYANNGTWTCNATAYNVQGYSTQNDSSTTIDSLYALNITEGLPFGDVQVNTPSNELTANVTNIGNMQINYTVQGYARVPGDNYSMNCSDGSNLNISNIAYSLASSSFSSKTSLDGSTQNVPTSMAKPTSLAIQKNITYWQIKPDLGSIGRRCEGYIAFTAQTT